MLASLQIKRLRSKSYSLNAHFARYITICRIQISKLNSSSSLRTDQLSQISKQYPHLPRYYSHSSTRRQNLIQTPDSSAVATNSADNTCVDKSQANFRFSTSYTETPSTDPTDVEAAAKDAASAPKKWRPAATLNSTYSSTKNRQQPFTPIIEHSPKPAHTFQWQFEAKPRAQDSSVVVSTERLANSQHNEDSLRNVGDSKTVGIGASTSVSTKRYTLEDLEIAQRGVETSFARNDPSAIIRRLRWGYVLGMEFTSSRTCAAGLWACAELVNSPMVSADLTYWLLRQLQKLQWSVGGGVPIDSVLRALKIVEREGHAHIMLREAKICKDHYGYLPADICRVALSLFINRRNWVVPANFIALVGDEIKVFIDVLVIELRARYTEQSVSKETLHLHTPQEQAQIQDIYDSVLGYYTRAGRRVEFKDLLEDYEKLGLAPPPTMVCKMLLVHSAWCNDTALSLQVVHWLLDPSRPAPAIDDTKAGSSNGSLQLVDEFESLQRNESEHINSGFSSEARTHAQGQSDAKRWTIRNPPPAPTLPTDSIDFFTIRRVLKCAVSNNDKELAAAAFKLFPKYQPNKEVAPVEYANCARVYLRDGDVSSAMEFLLMAEAAGVDFLRFYTAEWRWERESNIIVPTILPYEGKKTSNGLSANLGLQLESDICACLETSVRRLDDTYYMLLDLHRAGHKAPLIMLHAMIMAAGRVGQLDRAFATFRELRSLFGKVPVVQSYNALLFAVAHSTYARVSAMLPVLQGMEADGFTPDHISFSYLIQLMADTNDLQGYGEVLNHVKERGLQPTSQPLRRICVALARAGDWARVEETLTLLHNPCDMDEDFERNPAPTYFFRRLQYFREVQGLDLNPEWPEPLGSLLLNSYNRDNCSIDNAVNIVDEPTYG